MAPPPPHKLLSYSASAMQQRANAVRASVTVILMRGKGHEVEEVEGLRF
jgi:hypothetical protein